MLLDGSPTSLLLLAAGRVSTVVIASVGSLHLQATCEPCVVKVRYLDVQQQYDGASVRKLYDDVVLQVQRDTIL